MNFQDKKPLKIAIVTNNYTPYSGGVVSSIKSLFESLEEQNHIPFIVTLDFLNKKFPESDNIFRMSCPIKFTYKQNSMAIPFWPELEMAEIIKSEKPDIIHSQHPFLLGVNALNVSKKMQIPIVFTYHTQYENYAHYIPLPGIFTKPIISTLVKSYCKKVQGVIFPSLSIAKTASCLNLQNSIVVPSGILPLYFSSEPILKQNRTFELLTVSRFTKEKNILFLLDVFAQLKQEDFIFRLIGYGSELNFLKYYAYEKLKLSKERVIFIEKPSKDLLAYTYKKSDLFIFASRTETQGLVLAEAMAGSCPVIALNASGSCDIVDNGINGFLVGSIEEMVLKINYLKNEPDLCLQMQKQAWLKSKNYDSKNLTLNLVDFYNKILANSV